MGEGSKKFTTEETPAQKYWWGTTTTTCKYPVTMAYHAKAMNRHLFKSASIQSKFKSYNPVSNTSKIVMSCTNNAFPLSTQFTTKLNGISCCFESNKCHGKELFGRALKICLAKLM